MSRRRTPITPEALKPRVTHKPHWQTAKRSTIYTDLYDRLYELPKRGRVAWRLGTYEDHGDRCRIWEHESRERFTRHIGSMYFPVADEGQ